MRSAAAAQIPIPRIPSFLNPAMTRQTSEAIDSSTTAAVTTICITSWKDVISFPLSASGNIAYPTWETQFMTVNRCMPIRKSPEETLFSET